MRLLALLLVCIASPVAAFADCPRDGEPYPSFYASAARFEDAVAREAGHPPSPTRLSGITVPHHLVAGHLIARGFRAASGFAYERVILLTPDHFSRSGTPFATTRLGFETVFGPVPVDREAVDALLGEDGAVASSCLFGREHGLQALLPFMRHYLPGAKLVPVAISLEAGRSDWDRLAALLGSFADGRTLVVQSTDFSHYHPHERARLLDQQVLNVVASGDLDEVALLTQPDHLDSLGALYIQMKLQKERYGARPVAIASENQQQYASRRLTETTGYIVLIFGAFADSVFDHEDAAEVIYFAGDTHLGRAMTQALADADAVDRVTEAVLKRTQGRPLVVNLEGVILPNVPQALEHMTLAMPEALTIDLLRRLNVAAMGIANNHTMDLGPSGLAETVRALHAAGIAWFGQGDRLDIGSVSVVGLADIDSNGPPFVDLLSADLLDRITVTDATRPLVAFVHWGREHVTTPSARETFLADEMRLRGASVIVGAHPHVADGRLVPLAGGETVMAFSLGNFLFDQSAPQASGALLEMRVFEQGTHFIRLLELPNLFDLARGG